ncbi:Tn3 family transposase [Nonomuraea roseola]|uniref:Tn3 family transposase n=1 Tax=Nonomuraea roseola TaxID=46179 RepID=A0ABV5Q0D9_9ACTN
MPVSFVPARYADYLAKARKGGDDTAFRHYWEMCVILALRDGLCSGDVFVPGSRRYADPGAYLFTPEQWQPRLAEFCQLVRKPPTAAEAIAQVKDELHQALTDLEETLAGASPGDVGAVRLDEQGKLVIPPLSAEDIPAEAKALRDELASMLPFVPIASLLIELDARTSFLACFTHAGGRKSTLSVETKRNILAVLIAGATNLGLTRMSEACGVSYDTLAWTQQWYVREETLREANTVIVNHHYTLELAQKFGGGTMSSSDGQRFPVRGKSTTARDMVIHGGRVLSTYTHVSDQWSTYGTKQIVPTAREGHYAARYLSDPVYRRKISRQLNKGESLHALRRDLHYAQQGTIVRPHLQDQTEQAWCLTLLTNSVICWTTEYYGMGIGELRGQGREVGHDAQVDGPSARSGCPRTCSRTWDRRCWRAAVESPSHLRRRARSSQASAVRLLAVLLVEREREVTDALADLLIATVHRIPLMVRVLPVWVCPSQCSRRHPSRGFGAAPPPRWAEGP